MSARPSGVSSDVFLRTLLAATDDAIYATDADGIVTSWNDAAAALYGFTAAEMLGRSITTLFSERRSEEEQDIIRRVGAGESIRDVDAIRYRRDGSPVQVALTVVAICDESGTLTGTIRIARDVSGRKRADRALRRLAAIVESSDDAIVSKDLYGTVTSWNRAAAQMFGYTADEMIGESIRKLIPADRQSEEDDVLAAIRRGDKVDHFETTRRHKDGHLIPISLTVSPIRDGDGRVIGASKIARDISDRKHAEAELARLLARAEQDAAITDKLNQVGAVVASGLDRSKIVQAVTDTATELTTAEYGAFFYNVVDDDGEAYTLYTISGAARERFSGLPMPRNTAVFEPTFRGTGVVRSADITLDPKYGRNAPHYGMPAGHLPVRSYLSVPVKSRSGEVLGGLFFGHSMAGVFDERHERLAVGVASWAAVALENAQLYTEIQHASRLKDEFLATLSHELRTPLNAILGYARMIRDGIVGPAAQPRAVATIERNATALAQIVEDVLDVSSIISGKMRLNLGPVDLADVVKGALDAVAPAAEAKNIALESRLGADAHVASGDAERLQQVVWNLLSNAVKFTDRGGRIDVRLEAKDGVADLVVSDTGIGIPRAFLPYVFQRFRQADSSMTRERGGLGLGLAIARQLVELHGGTIEAKSEGQGKGATFHVRLPMVRSEAAGDPRPPAQGAVELSPLPDLRGIRVLAVDDDRDALQMVRDILEAAGGEVSVADSASSALKVLQAVRPDVLVADLGMPRMDGFELIARVRESPDRSVRDVRALALTAFARSEDRAKALRCGFQMHLAKPIDPAELTSVVYRLARAAADSVPHASA